MEEHLRRLSGMAGDVLGVREAMSPPKELHVLTLTQKLECVVLNELAAGRADEMEVAGASLAVFCDTFGKLKDPRETWSEFQSRAISHFLRGLKFVQKQVEEGRANG